MCAPRTGPPSVSQRSSTNKSLTSFTLSPLYPLSFLLSHCLSLHWSHFSSLASSLSSILSFPSFKNQNMFSVFLKRCCSVSLRPPFSLHQPVLCAHVLSYQLISPVPLFFHPASSLCNPLSLSSLSLFFSCHHSSIIKAKVTNPATL